MLNLWLVIPCYNEELVLPHTSKLLKECISALIAKGKISEKSRILFVDDRSKDQTWNLIGDLHKNDKLYTGIRFSHNRGQQKALLAGLMEARKYADVVISMDADLQDDISVLECFIDEYNKGHEIVYGVRSSRKKDTFMKRFTANCYYKLMHFLGVEEVSNHAEYRLLGKKALQALSEYQETNLYFRGLVPDMGFSSATVLYERKERGAGETKYSLKKMLGLAFDGITSFSVQPIRFIFCFGCLISLVSGVFLLALLITRCIGRGVTNWSFLFGIIFLLGGIQLAAIGIVGEYIGKILAEVKRRPRYIIEETFIDEEER